MEPSDSTSDKTLASRLTESLNRRFGLILVVVTILLIVDQAILQPKLARLSIYAPQINVAGRQRMLSQKLVKSALASSVADSQTVRSANLAEMEAALNLWRTSHEGLIHGDASLGLPPMNSIEIQQELSQLVPHYKSMVEAAEKLAQGEHEKSQLAILMQQEQLYLPIMDKIVGMVEAESRVEASMLRLLDLGAAGSVIGLMLALGWFVLVPATSTIRFQVETLEDRVHARTADLTLINETLQQEIQIRQQAEQRTYELSHQLAHTNRVLSLGQLAAGIAHEINQPVAAIANYAATCSLSLESEQCDMQRLKQTIDNIHSTAHRAGDIVRSMRNFLRPGQLKMTDISSDTLFADVVLICRAELQRHTVELSLELEQNSPNVLVEPTQIQQVLVNLVQNAIHSQLESPSQERRIVIRSKCEGAELLIEVIDAGPGFGKVPPEDVFEPFFTTKDIGLGLGLAIARSIIQHHAGRLWAENRTRGAAVCFTLPLNVSHEQAIVSEPDCLHR